MRKLSTVPAELTAAPRPSPPVTNCNSRTCPWWPYTNSNDFKANTGLILVILVCALICSVAFNAAVRYVVRVHCCQRRAEDDDDDEEDPKPDKEVEVPAVIYAEGMGGESECVICLSEFVVGDKMRVLDKCNHGFHFQCVQKWLVSHSSCPTCRANCTGTQSNTSSVVPGSTSS